MDDTDTDPVPVLLRSPVRIPPSAARVTDADEEVSASDLVFVSCLSRVAAQVFLLYTNLAARKAADGTSHFRGLGHMDSREDVLTISLNIGKPVEEQADKAHAVSVTTSSTKHKHRGASKRKVHGRECNEVETIEVEIAQDKTALRSRKGDTGSVLWHAR